MFNHFSRKIVVIAMTGISSLIFTPSPKPSETAFYMSPDNTTHDEFVKIPKQPSYGQLNGYSKVDYLTPPTNKRTQSWFDNEKKRKVLEYGSHVIEHVCFSNPSSSQTSRPNVRLPRSVASGSGKVGAAAMAGAGAVGAGYLLRRRSNTQS
ncbi:MAG: hypothetical protein NZ914_04845 [Gemmatales bacterium]|nr:hypothetical protein [Gemmatales bacterium]